MKTPRPSRIRPILNAALLTVGVITLLGALYVSTCSADGRYSCTVVDKTISTSPTVQYLVVLQFEPGHSPEGHGLYETYVLTPERYYRLSRGSRCDLVISRGIARIVPR